MRTLLILALLAATPAVAQPSAAVVDTCFVPAERCDIRIVAEIDGAQRDILVEAYGFTSRPIIGALLRARRRGVMVQVLLDRSNEHGRATGLAAMQKAGIPVWIDHVPGIAHVKAIVIDHRVVIGGSYNYTASAEHRNVEDVTITQSPDVAEQFARNWATRQSGAETPH